MLKILNQTFRRVDYSPRVDLLPSRWAHFKHKVQHKSQWERKKECTELKRTVNENLQFWVTKYALSLYLKSTQSRRS